MTNVISRAAEDIRNIKGALQKHACAAPGKEAEFWSCLQSLGGIADLLAGDVEVVEEAPAPPAKPKPIRTGNVLQVDRIVWPGAPKARRK